MLKRAQLPLILRDLSRKMVFLSGPRQVGKTHLAKQIADFFKYPLYLNYDHPEDRSIIQERNWLPRTDLLIFDEIHKMPQWKNYLKGLYDTKNPSLSILVTGSARLEWFQSAGDSLAGRYFLHRLLPFSLSEIKRIQHSTSLDTLIHSGGFPEPFLMTDPIDINRWRTHYIHSILSSDVLDVSNLNNIKTLRLLFELLTLRVGSPLSIQSLAEDLSVSPHTIKKYIEILESLYVVFRVTPFSKNIARSILKEPKIYFFDTGLVQGNEGIQLENHMAVSLLKYVYEKNDYCAEPYMLHYLRNKEGHEVDFVLSKKQTIQKMIEVKNSDKTLSPSLKFFHTKYQFPALQVVHHLRQEYQTQGISILKAHSFLSDLNGCEADKG